MPIPVTIQRRRGWEDITSPFERAYEHLVRKWAGEAPEESELLGAYPVDLAERENEILVEAELPGFKREEISVTVEETILRIVASRKPVQEEGLTEHIRERRYTRVDRVFDLPTAIDADRAEARLEDGVLYLRLPKPSESKATRIDVH